MTKNNIEIISVTNVRWYNEEKTKIYGDVKFSHLPMVVPFHGFEDYSEQHGQDFYHSALAGDYGIIGEYEPPIELSLEEKRLYAEPLDAAGIRLQLMAEDVYEEDITDIIDAIGDKAERSALRARWDFGTTFIRTDENFIKYAPDLGLDDEALDRIWKIV